MSEVERRGLLTTAEAAKYTGVSESTLNKMRCFGGGPIYMKLGGRLVRYAIGDLDAWKAACRRRSTWDNPRPQWNGH